MAWKPLANARQVYDEYPRPFWTLMGASFIDALGGALLFPFFTLYVTAKFGLGLSQVGLIFALLTLTNLAGSTIGGGLADRFRTKVDGDLRPGQQRGDRAGIGAGR